MYVLARGRKMRDTRDNALTEVKDASSSIARQSTMNSQISRGNVMKAMINNYYCNIREIHVIRVW